MRVRLIATILIATTVAALIPAVASASPTGTSSSTGGSVAAVSWGSGRVDLFATGADGQLYHNWGTDAGSWLPNLNQWESLGGNIVGDPVAASWGPGRLDVFVVGTDDAIYHKAWTGSAWAPSRTDWDYLGGATDEQPSVVSWGKNRLDLFVRGMNGAIYHKAWTGSGWAPSRTDWDNLGGSMPNTFTIAGDWAPAAASFGVNRLSVFARAADGGMSFKAWNGTSWQPPGTDWESHGGGVVGVPTATAWGYNRVDLFAAGYDGEIYHQAWGGSWLPSMTTWDNLGGQARGNLDGTTLSSPCVASWGGGRLDTFVTGADGAIYHKAWDGSTWRPSTTGWESLGGSTRGNPSVVAQSTNSLDLFAVATDGSVLHKAWRGSGWLPSRTDWESLGGSIAVPVS
jgi:hypothetical protein